MSKRTNKDKTSQPSPLHLWLAFQLEHSKFLAYICIFAEKSWYFLRGGQSRMRRCWMHPNIRFSVWLLKFLLFNLLIVDTWKWTLYEQTESRIVDYQKLVMSWKQLKYKNITWLDFIQNWLLYRFVRQMRIKVSVWTQSGVINGDSRK